jgi:hypothetical protein
MKLITYLTLGTMKKIFGFSLLLVFFAFGHNDLKADASLDDGKKKCKTGERCPTGTYKYCDDLGIGESCVCYYCR